MYLGVYSKQMKGKQLICLYDDYQLPALDLIIHATFKITNHLINDS